MSTTAPDERITTYTPVVPTTEFPALFPIFANDDLSVYVDGVERFDFTVTASYVAGVSNNAKVIMNTGVTGSVIVAGERDPRRQNRFGFGPIPPRDLNLAFDTVEGEVQEARRDIERSLRSEIGEPGLILDPNIEDGETLMKQGDRVVAGPNLPDLAASVIAEASAQADRARDEADRSGREADRADAEADRAAGYVNDIVSEKEVPITATRNGMTSILLPNGMISLEVRGFAFIGDGGGAKYRRISFADLVGFPALSYVRSLDRFMPNGTIDVFNGGYWLIDENEIIPQMLGAVVDGVTDATAACNAAAALADIIGADLRFTAGKHVLDPANGSALSMATYAHGDASLQAALVLPYKVRVRTSGTLTELLIKNLDSATSVGVAIGEDGSTGAGYSQRSFHCDGFMIRAIASTGRYGVVSPKNADLFNRKRPKYQLDHIHFAGQSDNKTVLQSPDEGWAVGVLIGDTYGYDGKITGQGTFLATANPSGQHQMTGFKASAAVGGFGVRPKMIMKSVYAGIDISDGVEGFSITDSEIWDSFRGVITSNALSEPGGFIDNVHTNCVRENFRLSNRSQIHIGKVECYRADGYYTDGATAWYGIRAIASEIDVGTVHGNVGDTFNAETAPALVHADSTSVVTVEQWRSRGLRRVAVFDGSPDCKLGDGTINNTTAIDTIIALGDGASDIQGGNVRVRAGTVSNYFTISGTVDKRRLTFPRTTSITIPKHDEIAPTAAGTTTVKPRLTASDWQVAMQAGSGAHTYDVILDHASAIDGDEVTVKVVGSSSANPTLRICSGSTATVLSSFNNITGTKRLWCRYVYSAANNLWREIIADSVESAY